MLIIQIALGIVLAVIILGLLSQPELLGGFIALAIIWIWYAIKIAAGIAGVVSVALFAFDLISHNPNKSDLYPEIICATVFFSINSMGKRFSIIWSMIEDERKKHEPIKSDFPTLDF